MNDLNETLARMQALAEGQAVAHEKMLELNGGVGKLGVEHPDLFDAVIRWDAYSANGHADTVLALLSAVQGVLALCDEADARQPEYFGFLVTPDVRKALSDALEGGCAVDHAERCCSEHGTHSMPHRGCILR